MGPGRGHGAELVIGGKNGTKGFCCLLVSNVDKNRVTAATLVALFGVYGDVARVKKIKGGTVGMRAFLFMPWCILS